MPPRPLHSTRRTAGLVIVLLVAVLIATSSVATNTLSIALSTNGWQIGDLPVGGVADTWQVSPGYFAVTNDGTVAAEILVSVSNSTPAGWAPAAFTGVDQFTMRISTNTSPVPIYSVIDLSGISVADALGTNQVLNFDLEFRAPTSVGALNQTQTIGVTILAIEAE